MRLLEKIRHTAFMVAVDKYVDAYIWLEEGHPEAFDTLHKWAGFIGGCLFGLLLVGLLNLVMCV